MSERDDAETQSYREEQGKSTAFASEAALPGSQSPASRSAAAT
jgi:hypothetical protein